MRTRWNNMKSLLLFLTDGIPSLHKVYNDLVESFHGSGLIILLLTVLRPILIFWLTPIWGIIALNIAWWSFWINFWMRLVHFWMNIVMMFFAPLRVVQTVVLGGVSFCSRHTMFWSADNLLDGVYSLTASFTSLWDDLGRGSLYDRLWGLYEDKKQQLTQRLSSFCRLPYRVLEVPSLMFSCKERLERLSLYDCVLYVQTTKD